MKFAPLALAIALTVAGCSGEQKADPNPESKPGLKVTDARLVLPAVSGNPGAAYFTLINTGPVDVTISAVAIDGAGKTELHEVNGNSMAPIPNYAVDSGESGVFTPGGRHVMAFDLGSSLSAGGKTEMTIVFSDGDKLSAPMAVEAPGSADHGAAH